MVDEVGLEPTMPLRRKIYSLLGLPIFLHIHIKFVSSCVSLIATIFPCNKVDRVKIRHLGYRSSLVASMDLVGVEPMTFYCFGPSKKPRQRDFLLLTLTKLGGLWGNRTGMLLSERF